MERERRDEERRSEKEWTDGRLDDASRRRSRADVAWLLLVCYWKGKMAIGRESCATLLELLELLDTRVFAMCRVPRDDVILVCRSFDLERIFKASSV